MTERLFLTGLLQTPHGGVPAVSPLFLVVFLALNSRLVFAGVASYQQLVALVAETHIIRKYPALVAHILHENHFMVLEHFFCSGLILAPMIVSLTFSCSPDCLNAMSIILGSTKATPESNVSFCVVCR